MGDIGRMRLVQIQRHDIAGRRVVFVADPVAFEETGDEIVAVRADVVGAGDGGYFFARSGAEGQGGPRGNSQELSTFHIHFFFGPPMIFMFEGSVNMLSVRSWLIFTLSEKISKSFSPFRSR